MSTKPRPVDVLGSYARFVNDYGDVLAEGRIVGWTDQPTYVVEGADGSQRSVLARFITSWTEDQLDPEEQG